MFAAALICNWIDIRGGGGLFPGAHTWQTHSFIYYQQWKFSDGKSVIFSIWTVTSCHFIHNKESRISHKHEKLFNLNIIIEIQGNTLNCTADINCFIR